MLHMKHIVFVIGHYKNGGVPMRATNLANELGKRDYKVTILVTKEIGAEIFFKLHENVELVSLTQFINQEKNNKLVLKDKVAREKQLKTYKRMRYFICNFPKWDKKLENQIRSIRKGEQLRTYMCLDSEAIYIPFGISYFEETFCAAEGLESKIIYAERNAPELELPKEKEKAENILNMLSKSQGAIFQTFDEKKFYENIICKNVAVIHNPIKENLPQPYEGERRKVIANYCRVALQKNLQLLIDSFAMLYKEYKDYTLEIYGNTVETHEEALRDELRRYIRTIGMEHCIQLLPPIADVHNKVRDCAMFVSSSDFEGLSNSMIEAMAIGLPCVCTDCLGGGAREVIQNEENGLIVPIKNVQALYEGMKRMIEDTELAKKCGKNASKIREEQSVDKIVNQWIEVIESV